MKKNIQNLTAVLLIVGFTATSASAQHFYVKVRPAFTVVHRPPSPSPRHVWIGPEWSWREGKYVEVPGYWSEPHPGKVWVTGHWNRSRFGSEWIGGHWR